MFLFGPVKTFVNTHLDFSEIKLFFSHYFSRSLFDKMHGNPRIIFKDFFSQCVKFDKFRFTKTELSLVYKKTASIRWLMLPICLRLCYFPGFPYAMG